MYMIMVILCNKIFMSVESLSSLFVRCFFFSVYWDILWFVYDFPFLLIKENNICQVSNDQRCHNHAKWWDRCTRYLVSNGTARLSLDQELVWTKSHWVVPGRGLLLNDHLVKSYLASFPIFPWLYVLNEIIISNHYFDWIDHAYNMWMYHEIIGLILTNL